ncbi:peptidyl-tRNA hydrolase [Dethiosulfatarculus sandiegensis]|uniref:Peptidyl-tRNA hydrolase n=1 Tax=Dethiosulfatarculus sandiegensis TaxID=1429043 RepID=A0A0D2K2N8_9BACT|nr:peptidyl-tRNA hydrolase [Dethiosulfatarculus sandiegensis]
MVLGLGNPGAGYDGTRHNLGYDVVAEFARRHGVQLSKGGLRQRKFRSLWGRQRVLGRPVILAQPQTFMNLSGEAAAAITGFFELTPDQVICVHDDLDLDLGRVKIARKGSAAGHNGIKSLIKHLSTDHFCRLKVGIGRPRYSEPIEQYVLNSFYADQRDLVSKVIGRAADCLEVMLAKGIQLAMQEFHRMEGEG